MLRKGALRVAALSQAHRMHGVAGEARVWFSSGKASGDDPTPAETKLAFESTVYGKDPAAAKELSPQHAAANEELKKKAAGSPASSAASKGNDPRAMFDSSLSQQADDGKASNAIKRDVASDTPDATRVAFRASAYGKDPDNAELSEHDAAQVDALRGRVTKGYTAAAPVHDGRNMFDSDLTQGAGNVPDADSIKRNVAADTPDRTRVAFRASAYGKDPQGAELSEQDAAEVEVMRSRVGKSSCAAAPIHDSRSMFDSDLTQGAGNVPSADSITRDVAADTPDATRVAFRASAYGKDPQSAEISEQDAAEVDVMRRRVSKSASAAAPLHDNRNMFDSDLTQGAGSTQTADSIKRNVAADTPDATRVAFRAMVYGKDPHSAREHSDDEAAQIKTMQRRVDKAPAATAPVHDSRSMFDSDLSHGAGSAPYSSSIKREVEADTPETTRLVFGGSDYGKDPVSMARSAEKQAQMDALAAKSMRRAAADRAGEPAPIHHPRSLFDSELTQGAGSVSESSEIKRGVTADTPEATRLAFGGSDYGKDPRSMSRSAEEQGEMEQLAVRATAAARASMMAPVHDSRSMFDSDLTQGAGVAEESSAIKRDVVPDTPELTRLSFFGSTYGDAAQSEESAEKTQALATKQKRGQKMAGAGRGPRRSKVHDTKKAMGDEDYSQAGAE